MAVPKSDLMAFSPTNYLSEDQFSGMDTNKENNDSTAVLSLVKFSRAPFVSFGTVKLGSSKSSFLRIDNPTDEAPIVVIVDKIASSKGFSVDQTKFTIEPDGSTILTITWTPVEEGGVRELITFIANGIVKHQAVLLGKVETPKKKKKSLWDSIKNKKTDPSVSYRTKKTESGPHKAANRTFHVPRQPQYKREKLKTPLFQCNSERPSLRPKAACERDHLIQEKPCTPQALKTQLKSLQDDFENIPHQSISPKVVLVPADKLLAVPTAGTPQTPAGLSERRVLNKTLSPIASTFRCKEQAYQSPLPVIKTHPAPAASDEAPLPESLGLSLKEALVIIDSDLSQPVSPPNACSSFDFSDSLESEMGGPSNELGECEASEDVTVPFQQNLAEPRLTFFVKPKPALELECRFEVSCEGSVPARPPVSSATITKSRVPSSPASNHHEHRIKTSRRKLLEELPSVNQVEPVDKPARNIGALPVIDLDTMASSAVSRQDFSPTGSSSGSAPITASHCSPLVSVPTPPSSSRATSQSAGRSPETVQCVPKVPVPDVRQQEVFAVHRPLPPHLGKKRKSDEFLREDVEDAKRTFQVKRGRAQTGQTETISRAPGKVPVARSTVEQKQPKAAVPSARSYTSRRTSRPQSKPAAPKTNQRAPSVKSVSLSTVKKSKVIAVAQSQLTFIKPVQTVIPRHPMPFAAKNMFYDERWIEKQERGFTWWINYVLTPDDFRVTTEVTKVNALSLATGDCKFAVPKAPTKEEMSLKTYTARRRLNRLRRSACQLFSSEAVVKAIQRLEMEVEAKRLLIRKDRHLWKDIGERQKVLNWLLSYNPLWLRIGLETIYGELISLESNNDVMGLAMFILGRLLWNPDIAAEYRHHKVPHLYKDGHEEALSRFTLKKLLLLVCFLDKAKESRLIEHDPCLFCMDAEFKTSKDLLLAFSRDFLSGEGILSRHLGHLGLAVSHIQTPLDEFDFAVRNLATDLRCGIRLVRVMELFLQDWSLSKRLRMPAICRLQKVHNVDLAFQVLRERGVDLKDERGTAIESRDIVDGHREKTLNLLWKIIFAFQVEVLLDEEQLKEEISFLRRTWRTKRKLNSLRTDKSVPLKAMKSQPEMKQSNVKITLLMDWVNAVCEFYNLKAENFTVAFSDGRILCHLVHHYHPGQLPLEKVRQETTQTIDCGHRGRVELNNSSSDSDTSINADPVAPNGLGSFSVDFKELLENEKSNFMLVNSAVSYLGGVPAMINPSDMSNTIPNEKVVTCFLSFLCTRLLDLRNETRAARVIQGAWRKYRLKKDLELYQMRNVAAAKIQAVVRRFLLRRQTEKHAVAAIAIQSAWRGYAARQALKCIRLAHLLACHNHAATIIQKIYKGWRTREFLRRNRAATVIQACYRMHTCRKEYHKLKCAAVSIQSWFRGCSQKRRFLTLKLQQSSAISIQSAYRGYLIRRQVAKMRRAALLIQRWFWACRQRDQERLHYLKMKQAAVTLQASYRGLQTRKELERRHQAALTIQTAFRMAVAQRAFRSLKRAAVVVQCRYRAKVLGEQVRRDHLELRHAAVTLQAIWRGRAHRKRIEELYRCTTLIQAQYRRHRAQSRFRAQRTAALVIQQQYRAMLSARQARTEYLQLRRAAVVLQAAYRGMQVRQELSTKNRAATVIQAYVRAFACHQRYLALRMATSVLQQHYRAQLLGRAERERYQQVQRATVKLQASFRGLLVRRRLQKECQAATLIQACFRAHKVRVAYLAAKCAATIIQQRYRAVVAGRRARKDFLEVRAAALKLQSAFRGMQARSHVRKMHTAATVIQAHFRGHIEVVRYQRSRWAAQLIQQRFRAHLARKTAVLEYSTLKSAALCIQAHYRGAIVRKRLAKMLNAATVIQQTYRTYKQRKEYLVLRETTIKIQRLFRATLMARQEQRQFCLLRDAAITVQSMYRGMKVRKDMQKQQRAATVIQAFYRMYRARVRFQAMRLASVVIQRQYRHHLRGKQFREDYLKLRQSATTVQAIFRGNRTRREIQRMHSAALIIQSQFRMHCCRTRYVRLLWATRILQEKFKANRMRNSYTQKYKAKKKAALTIQSAFRGYRARQEIKKRHKMATLIQRKYLTLKERKHFLALKSAAVFCQRLYRSQHMAMQCRQEYLNKRKACVTIQAYYRGMKVRQHLQQEQRAAVLIQAHIRKHLCRSYYIRLLRAVQVIQDQYRAKLEMKKDLEDYRRKKWAATVLQAAFHVMKARQRLQQMHQAARILQSHLRACHERRHYLALQASTLTVQRQYRAMKACREERQRYLGLRHAVVTLQAAFRGHKTRMEILRSHQAAKVIQASFRRHREHVKFQAMKLSAIIIQRHYRAYTMSRSVRREYIKLKESTIVIQSAFRGYCARQRAAEMHRAAIVIQSHFRRHRQWLSFRKQCWAAVVLQQRFRAVQLRNEHLHNYQQLRTAAVCLQAAYRGKKARELAKRMKAARTIQSFLKMSQKRRHYIKVKAASVTIQSAFRAQLAQRRYSEMRAAATVIQTWYRSCQQVQKERAMFKTVQHAVLTLQSAFRGMQARRSAKREHAAVKIQAVLRMAMHRRRLLLLRGSAIRLQASVRMYLARRSYLRQCSAALILQRRYRAQKAQREQRQHYLHTLRSLTILQAHLRRAVEQRRFQRLKKSAITIQAAFRGTIERRQLERQKAAAAVIQKHYRAQVHSQKERARFLKMKSSALLIQRAFRQYQFKKHAEQEQAAIKIQAWFRGTLARQHYVARQAAVATIHRCLQARLQRRRFLVLQQRTLLIQQRWRETLATRQQHRNYLNMKASAIAIQALWRGHRARQCIHKERLAATLIQAHFRGHSQRQGFRRLKEAALKVQRRFQAARKECLAKENERRRNAAATSLQAYCRGWLTRRRMMEAENAQRRLRFSAAVYHHLCAVKIQQAFRAHQALKAARKQIHSVICIQRWMKTKLQRKRYLEERRQVVVTQRAARAWLARRHRAATVIQRTVRGMLLSRRQEKMQRGIIRAQALWRGHCSRKLNDTRKIVAIRHRLRKINQEVKEEDCLRNKTTMAIGYLLGCHNFGYIILALKYLETATRLSPECCEHLVKSGATEKIVTLIRSCNRSLPSMETISLSIQVLLNLSKYNRTIEAVFAVEHAVDMLLDLLQIYREKAGDKMGDKGGSIFTKACFLLILLVQDRHRAAEVRNIPKAMDRLRSIYRLTMRKCKKDTERMVVRQKMNGSLNGSLLVPATPRKSKMPPRFVPEWVLRKDKLGDIIDPLCAIQMLASALSL
ncbi:hypothetical protein AALO_G00126000 [Alosa alosa]|uniref:Calponin-homology (CH) domain-containing protein n=1 Tax=Alosa alosa TaxID=278164 RepID=A0AAV6GLE2_9TELE|nr:abnormal spindle-like microcephaly-associated protein [Alosa alosa]KAG5275923.1 hypothetical protein AALO_G00126000 [Alosa alosa]